MKWKNSLAALMFGLAAAALVAQDKTTTTQTTTQQNPDGSIQSTTKTTTVSGSVVSYTPGRSIVLRSLDGRTMTYTIGSAAEVPADVQIGKNVTVSIEPASDGSGPAVVSRVETTSITPEGQMKTTTERTETSPSGQTKTTSTMISGTVTAFEPGQSITIEKPGHQSVTYVINSTSVLPQDLAVGKQVTVSTTTVSGDQSPVAGRVTYKTTTTKTKTKTISPQ